MRPGSSEVRRFSPNNQMAGSEPDAPLFYTHARASNMPAQFPKIDVPDSEPNARMFYTHARTSKMPARIPEVQARDSGLTVVMFYMRRPGSELPVRDFGSGGGYFTRQAKIYLHLILHIIVFIEYKIHRYLIGFCIDFGKVS